MTNSQQTGPLKFTREQADEQYDPTRWTRRLPREELLPAHVAFHSERSDGYRRALGDAQTTASFGSGELAGEMDVYHPGHLPADAPIVVYLHGGWWQWFSKEAFGYLARPFNERGYAVVMPGYRMAQDWSNNAPMESIVAQMQHALAEVLRRADANGAPAVHVVGHSAGGHLAAMLHRTDWSAFGLTESAQRKLRSVTSLAGLFDLRPLVGTYVNDAIGMTMAAAGSVSPFVLDTPRAPRCPLHLILPEFDTPEFFRQTKEYQEQLLRAGHACHLHVAMQRDHLDLIERMHDDDDAVLQHLLHRFSEAEVQETSRNWIASFNAGDVSRCAQGYTEDAEMHAAPVGRFQGRQAIQDFWSKFTADTGATDLRYRDIKIVAESPTRVLLSASWSMNVGRGIITRELWARQDDGNWRLEEDCFEVQEQF